MDQSKAKRASEPSSLSLQSSGSGSGSPSQRNANLDLNSNPASTSALTATAPVEVNANVGSVPDKEERRNKKPEPERKRTTAAENDGASRMKARSNRTTASAAILEAKRRALQERKNGNNNFEPVVQILEPEIVVMKDHLQPARDAKSQVRGATGLVYDLKMLEHRCLWDPDYPEKPERLAAAVQRCEQLGLISRCVPIPPRYADVKEVLTCHPQEHVNKLMEVCKAGDLSNMEDFSSNYDAIYVHPSTYELSLLSVGCTVDLVDAVATGKVQNGMAIIRPPGHHAMKAEYCGYCFFNNVAVAAKRVLDEGKASRVLIVDFDVHHGQATQQMFYNDKRVLYFSTHRYEHGDFWPNLEESNYNFIGSESGIGFNCNVPLNKTGLGNGDYMSIWHQILLPMAYDFNPDLIIVSAGYDCLYGCFEFNPDVVLVSAGFDSLQGDEKGEMEVTPQFVPHLLWPLLSLASGKMAVILEGGYCIKSLAEGAALSLRALLGDPCPVVPHLNGPENLLVETILNSKYMLQAYWNLLKVQRSTTEETFPLLKGKGLIHMPELKYTWTEPKQEKFLTRNCYPVQDESLKQRIDERLDSLIVSTDLSVAKSKVGIVYDDEMLKHRNLQEPYHPETPERISNIFANHVDYGLLERCQRISARTATEEELLLIHSEEHIALMKKTASMKKKELENCQERFNSIFLNSFSYQSALLSAGSVLQVVDCVVKNEVQSGIAIVRPPGHHAEQEYACGFCIFNNVALAAKYALDVHGLKRILIVDWDVHHGNGIQRMFESDPRVLYISVHRYDHGFFFPCSTDANFSVVGSGPGAGFTVNVPWNYSKMGDTEYLAAFLNVVLPIGYEFAPELVLVSAGFDAAKGDPLGGCSLTPEGYGHMTHLLSSLANGKIIVALEGGYNLTSIAYSMVMCTKALLGDPLPPLSLNKKIHPGAIESIRDTMKAHAPYWKSLAPFATKVLPHQRRLILRGSYTTATDLEDKMAELAIGNNNSSLVGENSELVEQSSSLSLSDTDVSSLSPAGRGETVNSSFEASPDQSQKKGTFTLTVVLDHSEEQEGACGGATMDGKHTVVLTNFDDAAPAAVYPLTTCPHLPQVQAVPGDGSIKTAAPCADCGHQGDNWVCLTCYTVCCGRFVNQHMVQHSTESGHQLALSFADLSIWCYGCDSYVRNEKLYEAYAAAHKDKFNEVPPKESFAA